MLGWVGLVPWLAALDRARSWRAAASLGLLLSVLFVLAVFTWFATAIQTYAGYPWPVALAGLLLVAPLLEPQFVTVAAVRHLARRRGAGPWRTGLASACAWVGTEWLWPKLFADTLGHGLLASPWLRQGADLAGAPGLTLVVLLANECGLAVGRAAATAGPTRVRVRRVLVPAACLLAMVAGLLAYGAARCRQLAVADGAEPAVTVGLVQADIGQYDRLAARVGTFDAVRTILDAHFALSTEALARSRLDLVVWPETVYPTTFGSPKSDAGADFDREIAAFVAAMGVPLVFGSYDAEDGREFNAAFFLEPPTQGRLTFETYRKAWLFPLIERVPAWLDSERVRRWLPWLGAWQPGAGPQAVALRLRDGRMLRIAPLICYDTVGPTVALGGVRAGGEVILTLSNDSWFTTGAGPQLHLMHAAFRSIETRRPQIRATNTGISAIIDPTGEIVARAGVHERRILTATVVPEKRAWSLMLAWGDWLGPTALAVGLGLLATL